MLNTILCNKQPEDKGFYRQVMKYLVYLILRIFQSKKTVNQEVRFV